MMEAQLLSSQALKLQAKGQNEVCGSFTRHLSLPFWAGMHVDWGMAFPDGRRRVDHRRVGLGAEGFSYANEVSIFDGLTAHRPFYAPTYPANRTQALRSYHRYRRSRRVRLGRAVFCVYEWVESGDDRRLVRRSIDRSYSPLWQVRRDCSLDGLYCFCGGLPRLIHRTD